MYLSVQFDLCISFNIQIAQEYIQSIYSPNLPWTTRGIDISTVIVFSINIFTTFSLFVWNSASSWVISSETPCPPSASIRARF